MQTSLPVVLFVSGDSRKLSALKKVLRDTLYVLECFNGQSGIDVALTTNLEALVLDAQLSDITPFKLCEEVRKVKDVPILVLTTNSKPSFSAELKRSGASSILYEPLTPEEIAKQIHLLIAAKKQQSTVDSLKTQITPVTPSKEDLKQRKILTEKALKAIATAKETSGLLSVLMIDLSGKDEHTELHKILAGHLRTNDILIPEGSSKYILVLPKTSLRAAEIIAETIRSEGTKAGLSLVLGISSFDNKAGEFGSAIAEFEKLVEGVSLAAAEARRTGRQIVIQPA